MNYTHKIFIALLCLLYACKTPYIASSKSDIHYPVQSLATDSLYDIEQLLIPYRNHISTQMNEVIGRANGTFIKEKPSGSLGNLIVTAMFEKAQKLHPEVIGAITNYGGIRIPEIKEGAITKGKIFELLPFENEMVLIELSKKELTTWLQFIREAQGWPMKGNFSSSIDNKHLEYSRSDSNRLFIVATNDYVANGGDQCVFLKSCKRIQTGLLLRDILIEYITKEKIITPDKSKQYTVE